MLQPRDVKIWGRSYSLLRSLVDIFCVRKSSRISKLDMSVYHRGCMIQRLTHCASNPGEGGRKFHGARSQPDLRHKTTIEEHPGDTKSPVTHPRDVSGALRRLLFIVFNTS